MVVALPFKVDHYNFFSLRDLQCWVERNVEPNSTVGIGMTDKQYSWYARLCGRNETTFNGLRIIFLDALR